MLVEDMTRSEKNLQNGWAMQKHGTRAMHNGGGNGIKGINLKKNMARNMMLWLPTFMRELVVGWSVKLKHVSTNLN